MLEFEGRNDDGASELAARASRASPAAASRATCSTSCRTPPSCTSSCAARPVSLHLPWDRCGDWSKLRGHAQALGLHFDAMNSHTFSDQAGQPLSYKFGSLTHTDPAARA